VRGVGDEMMRKACFWCANMRETHLAAACAGPSTSSPVGAPFEGDCLFVAEPKGTRAAVVTPNFPVVLAPALNPAPAPPLWSPVGVFSCVTIHMLRPEWSANRE